MKTRFFLLLIVLVFISCKTSKKEELKEFMLGSWQTTYIKIKMPTVNNTDSLSVYEDTFTKQNAGKAQSQYNKNGSFSAWFMQPNGEKVSETYGIWKTKNDSLYVEYPYMGSDVKAWYIIQKRENGFNGKVIYDWDVDGVHDDTLFMKTKRILFEE